MPLNFGFEHMVFCTAQSFCCSMARAAMLGLHLRCCYPHCCTLAASSTKRIPTACSLHLSHPCFIF